MKNKLLCLVILIIGTESHNDTEKVIPRMLYPNVYNVCADPSNTLVVVESRGHSDSLFYLWSALESPVLIIALTKPNASLNINCSKFDSSHFEDSISFSDEPTFTSAFQLINIIEYQDWKDVANLEKVDPSDVTFYNASLFDWKYEVTNGALSSYSFTANTYNHTNISDRTGISVEFHPNGYQEREKISPCLFYTTNSSIVKVTFDGVVLPATSNISRFGARMITLNGNPINNEYAYHHHKTLDDEYSPTVFDMFELITPVLANGERHFYQWRPVSFTRPEHDVNYATDLRHYSVNNISSDLLRQSTKFLQSVMGDIESLRVTAWNVTYGVEEDGFYAATNYTDWTFLTGYGTPIQDTYSLYVFVMTASCIIAPSIISLLGVPAIMIWKSWRNKVTVV